MYHNKSLHSIYNEKQKFNQNQHLSLQKKWQIYSIASSYHSTLTQLVTKADELNTKRPESVSQKGMLCIVVTMLMYWFRVAIQIPARVATKLCK